MKHSRKRSRCCPNPDCSLRGQSGKDNIIRHSFYITTQGRRRRYRCKKRGRTFSSTHRSEEASELGADHFGSMVQTLGLLRDRTAELPEHQESDAPGHAARSGMRLPILKRIPLTSISFASTLSLFGQMNNVTIDGAFSDWQDEVCFPDTDSSTETGPPVNPCGDYGGQRDMTGVCIASNFDTTDPADTVHLRSDFDITTISGPTRPTAAGSSTRTRTRLSSAPCASLLSLSVWLIRSPSSHHRAAYGSSPAATLPPRPARRLRWRLSGAPLPVPRAPASQGPICFRCAALRTRGWSARSRSATSAGPRELCSSSRAAALRPPYRTPAPSTAYSPSPSIPIREATPQSSYFVSASSEPGVKLF